MRRTIADRKAMPDAIVREGGPTIFECVWCGHRFDLAKAYEPLYMAYICPCCDAGHTEEGPHYVLERDGKAALRSYHRDRRDGREP